MPLPVVAKSSKTARTKAIVFGIGAEIRSTLTLVDTARYAYFCGDFPIAEWLWQKAEASCTAILRQITLLSEVEAELVEPQFTQFEMGLLQLAVLFTAAGEQPAGLLHCD